MKDILQPTPAPSPETQSFKSSESKTIFLESKGRKIAYRSIGQGSPIILAVRFRGVLDSWDPAFLDALAKNHRVIIFDYSGIGNSTGKRATTMPQMVDDIFDLADGLKLPQFTLGGWSMGGFATQQALVRAPERITHAILIGTAPPAKKFATPPQEFIDASAKQVMNLQDEEILLFDPTSARSKIAASKSHNRINLRKSDLSPIAPPELFEEHRVAIGDYMEDKVGVVQYLKATSTPILVICGANDVGSPPVTWYNESGKFPSIHLIVVPEAGHAPHFQYPELSVTYIQSFLNANLK